MATDFTVIVDPYLWKRLKNDDEIKSWVTAPKRRAISPLDSATD